jgi:glycosyltransferase involved in cell wall biosynthesis
MMTPEVSVVMSVYNGAATLEETLSSVRSQTGCEFEIIVVNDGSTDGSGAMLDEWSRRDSRIRVFHQSNCGLTLALVRGCEQARGEFIARQDVGDTSLPGRLAVQTEMLKKDPRLAFVASHHQLVGPRGETLADPETGSDASSDLLQSRDGSRHASPRHGTVIFRKSAYLQAGGYRPEFYFAQDVELWSRLIEIGALAYAPQVLYRAKFDFGSITARHRAAQEKLRSLAVEATSLRRAGKSEADVLRRARAVRPAPNTGAQSSRLRATEVAAAYFVGSCLAQRRNPRARAYLIQALRRDPLHLRSWYKLLLSVLTARADAP